ncbi:MAG TPA: hypothetical protein PLP21_10390 [Pyrinomonadaceae bacterium]|nr:hypothetical protein [Acidobacteriota bacterium]HQZ96719.1 hypothetical protein [Pyrinomonadaceae bacterium]
MKSNKLSFVMLLCLIALAAFSAVAQDDVFNDPTVDYSFTIPEAKWKMTVKPSATSPNVEYVYGDRFDGHLEVRKLSIPKGSIMADVVQDEEQKLQFRPGFVSGKEELISGKLKGSVYNFEYVAAGRNMSGRFYFLKANDTTIYILRFTGQKDSLRGLRNQTDSIARTFSVKAG